MKVFMLNLNSRTHEWLTASVSMGCEALRRTESPASARKYDTRKSPFCSSFEYHFNRESGPRSPLFWVADATVAGCPIIDASDGLLLVRNASYNSRRHSESGFT